MFKGLEDYNVSIIDLMLTLNHWATGNIWECDTSFFSLFLYIAPNFPITD